MRLRNYIFPAVTLLAFRSAPSRAQTAPAAQNPAAQNPAAMDSAAEYNEAGRVSADGRLLPYLIRRLPVSSFPQLPAQIAAELNARGCLVPQTYEAHRPENVIHASLERAGSSDWAVLCSVHGEVTLLVFFGSHPAQAMQVASAVEVQRLQAQGAGDVLGFNWGIDPATPEQVQEAVRGSALPALDHDAVSDSVIEHQTVYHYFAKGRWTVVEATE
ncbi:MAG TPA: hypothetical protein VFU55_06160 [Terracidiphilus sp.]|nr:hypothetical protein [Terracidiphilus sp.]